MSQLWSDEKRDTEILVILKIKTRQKNNLAASVDFGAAATNTSMHEKNGKPDEQVSEM